MRGALVFHPGSPRARPSDEATTGACEPAVCASARSCPNRAWQGPLGIAECLLLDRPVPCGHAVFDRRRRLSIRPSSISHSSEILTRIESGVPSLRGGPSIAETDAYGSWSPGHGPRSAKAIR